MRSVSRPAIPGAIAPLRIVCLPGAYDGVEAFLSAGFDASVRARGLNADLVFVEPQLAHLTDRGFRERLRSEFLMPARADGCRTLWLAGISLGGFIALDYASCHPQDLDGVCLLAPYLGSRIVTREIARAAEAGGRPSDALAEFAEERRIWRFVQERPAGHPALYLGYGREDRFAAAHELLAHSLPPQAVGVAPGGHDWETFARLWVNFLDSRFG
jgi:hypothetical protein